MPAPTGRFASANPYGRTAPSPAASTTDLLAHEKPNAAMMQAPLSPGGLTPRTGHTFLGPGSRRGSESTLSDKYSLAPDPRQWGSGISMQDREPDDDLHNPDPRRDHRIDRGGSICTGRGILNLGCLLILSLGLLMLFAGYPLLSYFLTKAPETLGGYNIGGVNATGQVPDMIGNFGLIDKDTPTEALTRTSWEDGSEWDLVFSDEFNTPGRSFYPGDDPYWEAVDLHYWGTNNLEWYDPSALTTEGGNLKVTLSKSTPKYHGLDYMGGMMSTWNKFCFTGGYFEANVSLPGSTKAYGLWPAIWAMGNLGRAGYGASLDGTWPYTYDTCDVGTLANQSYTTTTPPGAHTHGDPGKDGELSFLPGQRLSACTCKDQAHPGPKRADGSFVGRAAPEIDMFEAQVSGDYVGHVSQSGQWAPFNYAYDWFNTTANFKIYNSTIAKLNDYKGGAYQQSTSGLVITNQECYSAGGGCFSVYGFEYKPGYDGYITWVNDGKPSWSIYGAGMGPDTRVELTGGRPVPVEPMYMIINLGISPNFGAIDWDNLIFPSYMLVDWIRVYQPKDAHNIGCDPPEYPTREYINTFIEAYTNPNLTTWVDDYGQVIPKNRLVDKCE
ncbi:Glycoside hydrolase family 16 protein [Ceratobasidium theobromae]|uniref:Glycoside hydrolase family 16 protein n=1 Tax=Ceratobasidium theobromae TaxID=1582974 RepID=A0A5N5QU94_9AGAM|nr:Glycoside hydrolase family 16 protein [Ceratobasidium theobromae]